MATVPAKRSRSMPLKIAKMRERKRVKLSDSGLDDGMNDSKLQRNESIMTGPPRTEKKLSSSLTDKRNGKRQNVRLDGLAWSEIQPPDQMDDYEGFFGLEEIDGIDVVKGENGVVAFTKVLGSRNGSGSHGKDSRNEDDRRKLKSEKSRDRKTKGRVGKVVKADNIEELDDGDVDVVFDGLEDEEEFDSEWSGIDSEHETSPGITEGMNGEIDVNPDIKLTLRVPNSNGKTILEESLDLELEEGAADLEPDVNPFTLLEEQDDDPTIESDMSAWRSLHMPPSILASLSRLKFQNPTPIQLVAIPKIQSGVDVIGKAPTGSGKTLAFGLPIIQAWLEEHLSHTQNERTSNQNKAQHKPTALIIEPTRELATQVADHLRAVCQGESENELSRISICTLTGGLSIQKQRRLVQQADIIVATPGRLWEVVSEAHGVLESLKRLSFLVVDEADRLLSQGHFSDLEEFLNTLERNETHDKWTSENGTSGVGSQNRKSGTPMSTQDSEDRSPETPNQQPKSQRQTLVFSATFSDGLQQKLVNRTSKRALSSSLSASENMMYLLQRLPFQPQRKPTYVDISSLKPTSNTSTTSNTKQHPSTTTLLAPNLKEGLLETPGPEKDLYLYALILILLHEHQTGSLQTQDQPPPDPSTQQASSKDLRLLIFVNSISTVQRLVPFLEHLNITAQGLHSHMAQPARLRSIERFSAGEASSQPHAPHSSHSSKSALSSSTSSASNPKNTTAKRHLKILIATDVAARGLDIPNINTVIHYHVPRTYDAYIHRSGRTARAGREGTSILMSSPSETAGVRRLVARVHVTSSPTPANTSSALGDTFLNTEVSDGSDQKPKPNSRKEKKKGALVPLTINPPSILSKLKARVQLAQRITSIESAKVRVNSSERWISEAARDLGSVVNDEEEEVVEELTIEKKSMKTQRRESDAMISKQQLKGMTASLREMLGVKVNTGVSTRYLTSGSINVSVGGSGSGGGNGKRGGKMGGGNVQGKLGGATVVNGVDLGRLLKEREARLRMNGGDGGGEVGDFLGPVEGLGF